MGGALTSSNWSIKQTRQGVISFMRLYSFMEAVVDLENILKWGKIFSGGHCSTIIR